MSIAESRCVVRFDGGWIKLHRSLLDHWTGQDFVSLGIFTKLILMANYKSSKIVRHGKLVPLEVGQVLTTVRQIQGDTEISRATIERRLDLMQQDGMIAQKVSNHGRIITIVNYEKYQKYIDDDEQLDVHPAIQPKSNQRATKEQPKSTDVAYIEEAKNLRIKEIKNLIPFTETLAHPGDENLISPLPKKIRKPKEPAKGGPTWEAYSQAYALRYGHPPARNARDNAICAQIVDRIGAEEAPKVAAFYLGHHDQWYVKQLHPTTLLLKDVQKLRTEMIAGVKMTSNMARNAEIVDQNQKSLEEYKRSRGI